jgi:hypothetical protein
MHPMHLWRLAIGVAAVATAACIADYPERDRRRFECGYLQVVVSTRQRMPESFGGEEYVYANWTPRGGAPIKREIDINGRWTDRLSASVAEDGSWVRFHLTDPAAPLETVTRRDVDGDGELDFVAERPGAAPRRYPYSYKAYIEVPSGQVVRFGVAHSTKEEREAGWFTSTEELAVEQTLRGRRLTWRPCT